MCSSTEPTTDVCIFSTTISLSKLVQTILIQFLPATCTLHVATTLCRPVSPNSRPPMLASLVYHTVAAVSGGFLIIHSVFTILHLTKNGRSKHLLYVVRLTIALGCSLAK